jgi:hypothetical protein
MAIFERQSGLKQRILYCGAALLMMSFSLPPTALADTPAQPETSTEPTPVVTETTTPVTEPESTPSEDPPAAPPPQGPQEPAGADSTTYTYNEATGLWENDQYTWNPATNQTSPKTTPTYSYNPSTGLWDTTEWVYDAPSGVYVPNVISIASPPADAVLASDAKDTSPNATSEDPTAEATAGHSPQSSSALSSPSPSSGSSGVFDLFYNAFISNNITSSAVTGDALVSMNTLAGNALSGDAKAIATVLNLLHSTWNLGVTGNLFSTFTQNLFGNLIGDLWLNPGGTTGSSTSPLPSDVTVNASQNAAIHNTISLEATSGAASVSNNTEAGDATSGSATAIANIINAINSSITSGHSFLGMLNIYGSLDGDILLPEDLISTLLGSNAIGTLDTSQINNASILGNFDNNLTTTNNINASASSGSAAVANNTSAGSATSGDANTNVTVLNLTGRQVVGKNALLVFVNVLGTWVGMIVDAPTGSTSAALGGGITENNSLAINASTNQAITNDVNVSATTGDTLVSNNTTAGNARSGDAAAAVNILNMNGSQFALSDWFGVLFINVFGSWNGSFGIDTAAGSLPMAAIQNLPSNTYTPTIAASAIKAFSFVPGTEDGTYTLESSDEGAQALAEAQVLSTDTSAPANKTVSDPLANLAGQRDWTLTLIGMGLGLSLLGAERVASRRDALRHAAAAATKKRR